MQISINLDEDQVQQYNDWTREQNILAIKKQKENSYARSAHITVMKESWDMGYPYGGAIGGAETWMITHTSIGTIIKIKHTFTENVLDLTDYNSW